MKFIVLSVTLQALELFLLGTLASNAAFTKELPVHNSLYTGSYLRDHRVRADPNPDACPNHPKPIPLPSPLPANISKALANLTESLKLVTNETCAPGVVAAVAYQGQRLLSVGYGTIKKGSQTVPNGDTIFRIGSITKIFAVLVMYQLYDRGHIKSLDDPLSHYCSKFSMKNPYDLENVVTLRQMAAELSGLPPNPPCFPNILTKNICPSTTDEILSRLKDQYLPMTGWTRPSYSNLAYALLGHCIIHHYDPLTTFERYVEHNILKPLGMTSTGFDYTKSVKSRMATGYDGQGNEESAFDLGWVGPAGQMYSTLNDLMKFAEFFNSYGLGGKVLSPHLVKEMLLPAFIDYDLRSGFGSPFELILEGSYLIISKGGSYGGYSGFFSFIPELQLSYVVLQNCDTITQGIVAFPYALLLEAFVPYLTNSQPKYPVPTNPEAYIGTYKDIFGAINFTVFEYEGQLMILIPQMNLPVYLSYKEDGLFQLALPPLLPCIYYEVIGFNNQWWYFEKIDSTGKSPGFTFPGYYGMDKFHRT